MSTIRILVAALLLGLVEPALAQRPQPQALAPDERGEAVTLEPVYNGVTANAPIPASLHLENEGGSDGAGLCVYTSQLIDGRYQDVIELRDGKGSKLWIHVKARPGGSYPEKLEADLKAVGFQTPWFQAEMTAAEAISLIRKYNEMGLPVAVTTNTGRLYKYKMIHHMVSLIHIDDEAVCLVDNNDPGAFHWMPLAEFARRFEDGPKGWFVVILYGQKTPADGPWGPAAASLAMAGAALIVLTKR